MTARIALGGLLLLAVGCTPKIGNDPLPEVMEFDPTASPPRVAEPNFAVVPPGKNINLALGGIAVPADCATTKDMPQAQCEFFHYLQSLDGFPTSSPARTPVSAPIDLTTVPGNVVVVDAVRGSVIDKAVIGFDPAAKYLTVGPPKRWDVGGFFWIGVRGYDSGLHSTTGKPFVASVPYALLKRDDSLTCMATDGPSIPTDCPAFKLLSQSMNAGAAQSSLVQLEGLRQAFVNLKGWDVMAAQGLPKSDVAMLWGFPTHSGPVIDIDPINGLAPAVSAPDQIDLTINGALDPATVKAFAVGSAGTLVLMDLTILGMDGGIAGFPRATATVNGTTLSIKLDAPLTKGHTYGIMISNAAKSPDGKPLVLPPVSAMLMFKGALFQDGHTNISNVDGLQAALLEQGRQQLVALLASPAVWTLTGLQQKDLAYLFAFQIP